MNHALAIAPATSGLDTIQSLLLLAVCLALSVAALTAVMQCRMRGLHDRLRMGWLGDLLLSRDPRQRSLCLWQLVGIANCLAGVGALNYGITTKDVDPASGQWLTVIALGTATGFYLLTRTGLNQRLKDPKVIAPQIGCVVMFLAWGYLIGGTGRPVALMVLFLILMFTMFTTDTRTVVRASALAALTFGPVMWHICVTHENLPGQPKLQVVYFSVLAIILISMCLLVTQLTRLRIKASRRKQELTEALARIQELATRDDLTGLYNRRHMAALLDIEAHRSMRTGRPFCIGLIDVDHFKAINDQHGHGVGDEVLTSLAAIIKNGLREEDVAARWGGEEFLVLFTDSDDLTAELVLSRIQTALCTATVSLGVPELRVAFSAGIATHAVHEAPARTIDRADQGLYDAKRAGRDRICRMGLTERAQHAPPLSPRPDLCQPAQGSA